ncbi:DsbA family protein [Prauserella cavernicola]|uniref:Thioredoxin domain-containing protein n=1 Tax=Prauserella cavernicola TaxID=2800127 RepID=A0A934V345_9PSEU|nr:thioredoxin domain-containing protein [Prauserella cavernicola]MBK1783897.1 thioredoxin domain-containing protein [Prauserella cavernicola]
MTRNTKISLTLIGVVVAVVAVLLVANRPSGERAAGSGEPGSGATPGAAAPVVRPDSHRLSAAPDGKVTLVEFLDLECEACRAAYPAVETLREEYAGRVTFVIRYFPVPGHRNAELAARAVEAASRQGKLEGMYHTMYETQPQWGEAQVDHRDTFLGFARELGLDMATFRRDLDDPATIARVLKDRDDGVRLGVSGTPTFFLNGEPLTGPLSLDIIRDRLDAELAR